MIGEARLDGPIWFQTMPPDWKLQKFSWVVDIAEGQIDPEDPRHSDLTLIAPNHIESGTGRLLARETATEQGAISSKYPCRLGDVLYSKIRPALRKATIAEEDCLCSADMYPLRPKETLSSRYLLYLIVSKPFTEWVVLESDRVAMPKINRESLNDLRIPIPPVEVQERLVEFLNSSVTRIDELVGAKQRLLNLLSEKRKAIIATAITRGLDPNVKLRDSGVPWLGEIPAHWRVIRAGLTGSILMGRQRAPQYEKGEHIRPYLRVANVFDGYIDFGDVLEMNFDPMEQVIFDIRPNDILLNEGQSRELVGRSAIYKGEPNQYCFQNTLIRFRCGPNLLAGFAQVQFSNWLQHGVFQAFSRQSTNIAHLGADRLAQIRMAVPPVEEQHAIVEHIERETARLDAVRTATERTIALLKERRSALIAAAVTGQLDVEAEK